MVLLLVFPLPQDEGAAPDVSEGRLRADPVQVMPGAHRKHRDTTELFVDIRQRRRGGWSARCKMIGCSWKTTGTTEIVVGKAWVQHFTETHVAKWDERT